MTFLIQYSISFDRNHILTFIRVLHILPIFTHVHIADGSGNTYSAVVCAEKTEKRQRDWGSSAKCAGICARICVCVFIRDCWATSLHTYESLFKFYRRFLCIAKTVALRFPLLYRSNSSVFGRKLAMGNNFVKSTTNETDDSSHFFLTCSFFEASRICFYVGNVAAEGLYKWNKIVVHSHISNWVLNFSNDFYIAINKFDRMFTCPQQYKRLVKWFWKTIKTLSGNV